MNARLSKKRVLVIDDDEDDRVALAAILEGAGYEVHEAISGNHALSVYLERAPHLVITDIVMKDGDGIDAITTLRRLKPNLGIIAITGKGPSAAAAAKGMAVHYVLEKPVDADVLLESVAALLRPRPPDG